MPSEIKNIKIGSQFKIGGQKVFCRKTDKLFTCCKCHFFEKGPHCPQGKKLPLCFAQERADRESVYYPNSKSNKVE